MHIYLKKTLNGFVIADESSFDGWQKLKLGEVYRAEVKRPRNYKFHCKFWALMTVVHRNIPEPLEALFPTKEKLVDAIKDEMDFVTERHTITGEVVRVPKSISFGSMNQDAFDDFYEQCFRVICRLIIPGIEDEDLREAVELELSRR